MDTNKNLRRILYNISPKTGKGSIYIQYSQKGKPKRFPTGIKIDANKWDALNFKPKRGALSTGDQNIVDNIYNKLADLITKYQFEFNRLPTIAYLEENLNKTASTIDIHGLFNEFIEVKKVKLPKSTTNYYLKAATVLKEVDTHYNYNLTLNNFNYNFFEKFFEYSATIKEKKNSNNTINQRIDVFKGFVNWLDKKEIQHGINTSTWEKLDKDFIDLICLEREELNEILNYVPVTDREQKTKDIILFLSHTGIRSGDLNNISKEHFLNGCLEFYPQKTIRWKIKVIIPLAKPVIEILERYDYNVPMYTPKYLNDFIQEFCAKIPSLKKKIEYKGNMVEKHTILKSHSIGRKTFLNLCIQAGIPLPTIMGMSGHTSIDTILKKYLDKHMNNLPQISKVFQF